MKIKVITVWQPWASLFPLGLKEIETRGWATKYRGPMAIHAAKKIIPFEELFDDLNFIQRALIMDAICREYGDYDKMPTGAIIATGVLGDVQTTEVLRDKIRPVEMACGDYSDGRFGWMFKDVEKLAEPVYVKGQQGLWNWEGDLYGHR